jgi:hypothetical protein
LYAKVKAQVMNFAKARREMAGPKPMEVDRVATSWAYWSLDGWGEDYLGNWANTEQEVDDNTKESEDSHVQFVGKGDGKSKGAAPIEAKAPPAAPGATPRSS